MKKMKIFGKQISLLLGTGIILATIVTAVLLTYFGKIVTTVNVQQSVLLDGRAWDDPVLETIPEAAPGGEEFCFLHKVKNQASIDIPIVFDITCEGDSDCEGITETTYNVPETATLDLCAKDSSTWQCVSGATATLTFDTVNPAFKYDLAVTGLQANKEYALIYYSDRDPRFDLWGGDNPGKVIATFMTDGSGNYVVTDTVDISMNLPSSPDWNINPNPDYCDSHNGYDNYNHCSGAKIWIVPTEDLTDDAELPLTAWNPSNYLFETDLIVYSDCDFESGLGFVVDMEKGEEITDALMTHSGTTIPVLVCYEFDVMIEPGEYTITTTILASETI